jgi:hypothetical protein
MFTEGEFILNNNSFLFLTNEGYSIKSDDIGQAELIFSYRKVTVGNSYNIKYANKVIDNNMFQHFIIILNMMCFTNIYKVFNQNGKIVYNNLLFYFDYIKVLNRF